MVVRRNYGSSRIVNLMDFGEYVKTSRSGVLYCGPNLTFKTTKSSKVLLSSLMEKLLQLGLKIDRKNTNQCLSALRMEY